MGTRLTTVSPKIGYEYRRRRHLPESEWERIKKEFFGIFSFWGYNSVSYIYCPSPGKLLAFYLQRFYERGNETKKIPDNIKSGILMGSILVDFAYSYHILLDSKALSPIVPLAICMEPVPNWEGYFKCDRTMTAIERVHDEGILSDYFKLVYCCLPDAIGFTTSVDLPNHSI